MGCVSHATTCDVTGPVVKWAPWLVTTCTNHGIRMSIKGFFPTHPKYFGWLCQKIVGYLGYLVLVPLSAHISPLWLPNTWFCQSFFFKKKLSFSVMSLMVYLMVLAITSLLPWHQASVIRGTNNGLTQRRRAGCKTSAPLQQHGLNWPWSGCSASFANTASK